MKVVDDYRWLEESGSPVVKPWTDAQNQYSRAWLDPNEVEPKGQVAMDWFVPSPDGKLIAVCLSANDSEEGTLHFDRTENGEHLSNRIHRVQYPTGGGSAAWTPDGSAAFYTRYPHQGEKPGADLNFFRQIYFHKLGDHYLGFAKTFALKGMAFAGTTLELMKANPAHR